MLFLLHIKLKLFSSCFHFGTLFVILCDKAFISYLTPKLTHNEPYIEWPHRNSAYTHSVFYLLLSGSGLEERRAPGRERERRYFSLALRAEQQSAFLR
jgi:hypothetical protein